MQQSPSKLVLVCVPAGNKDILREIKSESGKHAAKLLLRRYYREGIDIDFRHVPAMLRLSAPGALCAWYGVVLSSARDGHR